MLILVTVTLVVAVLLVLAVGWAVRSWISGREPGDRDTASPRADREARPVPEVPVVEAARVTDRQGIDEDDEDTEDDFDEDGEYAEEEYDDEDFDEDADEYDEEEHDAFGLRLTPVPDGHVWRDPQAVARYVEPMKGLGLTEVGSFLLELMGPVRLAVWADVERSGYAVLYEADMAQRPWVDFGCFYEDGRTFTMSSAYAGHELDHPEGKQLVWDVKAGSARLHERFLAERPDGRIEPTPADPRVFSRWFLKATLEDMAWREGRGGVTEEEIRAVAEASGIAIDQDAVDQLRDEYVEEGRGGMLPLGGEESLVAAAGAGNLAAVRRFLDAGEEPDQRDKSGRVALVAAAEAGQIEVVEELLKLGASVEAREVDPESLDGSDGPANPAEAMSSGFARLAGTMLGVEADAAEPGPPGTTALMAAAAGGHDRVVRVLLDAGADPSARDDENYNPLSLAAEGHVAVVQQLVDAGSDLDVQSFEGATPLLVAVLADHPEVARILVDAGASTESRGPLGIGPLTAALDQDNPTLCQILLDAGADPNARSLGGPALHQAMEKGWLEVVQALLDGGADPEVRDRAGLTALMKAAALGQLDLVQRLLDAGANHQAVAGPAPTAPSNRGAGVDQAAVIEEENFDGGVDVYHDTDDFDEADTDDFDEDEPEDGGLFGQASPRGGTALHIASRQGALAIVNALLTAGADVNRTDARGRTPLLLAESGGHRDVADRLQEAGAVDRAEDREQIRQAQLVRAVAEGDSERVRQLLADGASPSTVAKAADDYQQVVASSGRMNVRFVESDFDMDMLTGEIEDEEAERRALREAEGADEADEDDEDPQARGDRPVLMLAAEAGHVEVVRVLLEAGADPQAKVEGGMPPWDQTALHLAAAKNRAEVIGMLIEAGAALDAKTRDMDGGGDTALHFAAEEGHREAVEALLKAGAPILLENESYQTPIQLAARSQRMAVLGPFLDALRDREIPVFPEMLAAAIEGGSPEIVARLLKAGADPNAADNRQHRPLALATRTSSDLVAQLLEAGAEVDGREDEQQATPLLYAVDARRVPAVDALLQAGADPNRAGLKPEFEGDWDEDSEEPEDDEPKFDGFDSDPDPDPEAVEAEPTRLPITPLSLAARRGHLKILKRLIDAGADVDARDSTGKTPLIRAAEAGRLEVVQLLLEEGADREARDDREERTALIWASQAGRTRIVSALLEAGVDREASGRDGRTAAGLAGELGRRRVLKVLAKAGAMEDLTANRELVLASQQGDLDAMHSALGAGADPNTVIRRPKAAPRTALEAAARSGSEEAVALLLEAGADPSRGQPLVPAVQAGSRPLVERLIEAGVDPSVASPAANGQDGPTPLGLAVLRRASELVDVLLDAGADPDGQTRLIPDFPVSETPLMVAARINDETVVKRLLVAGADPNRRVRGRGPLSVAVDYHHNPEVIDLLRNAGAEVDSRSQPYLDAATLVERSQRPEFRALAERIAEATGVGPTESGHPEGAIGFQLADVRALNKAMFAGTIDNRQRLREREERTERIDALHRRFFDEAQRAGSYLLMRMDALSGPVGLALLPLADKYAVLAAHGTAACNYDLSNGDIIAWLQEMEREQPWILTDCGHDRIEGRFIAPIRDPERLARRMYKFCPDIVDQGTGDVAKLVRSLRESDRLYFWWD